MADTLIQSPRLNRILAALPTEEYTHLADDLEFVFLTIGQVLNEPGDSLQFAYFPTTCIVSLVFTTEDGASSELAMTGNDGLVGIPLVLGGETTTHKVVVQTAGCAYRLRAQTLRWELAQGGNLQHLSLNYTQALMTQLAQSIVCNRHHTLDQRLCRRLLLCLDQLPGNQLETTQEMIANMLGVRREGVTEAAGKLQDAGLIRYSRGHITVVDRPGLEARACECYRVVKSEYERLFHTQPAIPSANRVRANPALLRKRAEALLRQTLPTMPSTLLDSERFLHELQVHQVELEMQNEELRLAYEEVDNLRAKYAEIYDFAPVAYITLDALGGILQLNLAGAILLGVKRSQIGSYRFPAFVEPESLAEFHRFHQEVLDGKCKKRGEIVLAATATRPPMEARLEAIANESGSECRMVVIDVSAEKAAPMGLRDAVAWASPRLKSRPLRRSKRSGMAAHREQE